VAKVVVVCLEKQWFLIHSFSQLDQPQQGVLSELASPLIVDVDAPDAVSIETACPVLTLHV
jgi:hypothetical protein